MRSSAILSVLSAVALASAQGTDAPIVSSNPKGASFAATLPNSETSNLRGTISAQSAANGSGVEFAVSLTGFPASGGPFLYHIHEKPVPADGNCTGTGAHLDPYKRGEDPPCDSSKKQSCQTGDLSGKYGKINGSSFSAAYKDLYTATDNTNPSYFGNLSFVVHLANKTRIGCANFSAIALVQPSVSGVPTPSSNATLSLYSTATGTGGAGAIEPTGSSGATPPSPSAPQSTGGASVAGISFVAVMFGAIVFAL